MNTANRPDCDSPHQGRDPLDGALRGGGGRLWALPSSSTTANQPALLPTPPIYRPTT